jgi:hypothetical protein
MNAKEAANRGTFSPEVRSLLNSLYDAVALPDIATVHYIITCQNVTKRARTVNGGWLDYSTLSNRPLRGLLLIPTEGEAQVRVGEIAERLGEHAVAWELSYEEYTE